MKFFFILKIGYALTNYGDIKQRLSLAFDCYDLDGNGYITTDELKQVISGMFSLLRADKRSMDETAKECLALLDTSKDGRVTKGILTKQTYNQSC